MECDEAEENDEDLQKKRLEKKRKLRELFDESYDDGDAKCLDVLKEEVQKQAEVYQIRSAPENEAYWFP